MKITVSAVRAITKIDNLAQWVRDNGYELHALGKRVLFGDGRRTFYQVYKQGATSQMGTVNNDGTGWVFVPADLSVDEHALDGLNINLNSGANMKVVLASKSDMGREELTPLNDGESVPLSKVRLRQGYIKNLAIPDLQKRIKQAKLSSDLDTAKELDEELDQMKDRLALLSGITAKDDFRKYNEYLSQFGK